ILCLMESNHFANDILTNIVQKYYPNWFNKRLAVQYPSHVKKIFKIFATMALNYNVTLDYHYDKNNDGLSVVVPIGEWNEGCLVFTQIKTIVELQKGEAKS
ncbi:21400_t:CDS:2, partial [Dentiscutata erythropus]